MKTDSHSDEEIRKMYSFKNIAVVGMSKNADKAAHYVPKYLIERGYNIIPVNPTATEILGKKCYTRVSEVLEPVDVVDIFRPSEAVAQVVDDVLMKPGIKLIWMQEGIYNEEAERAARQNSLEVVFNRCLMAEHRRLFGQ